MTKRSSDVLSKAKSDSKELEHLREQISLVTNSVLKLVKSRQDLARKVARIKASRGLPIEDARIEERLKQKVTKYSSKLGLDNELALDLLEVLLNASKTIQRKQVFREKISSFLRSNKIRTISIVGSGRMGGWFAGYFKSFGTNVILFDKRKSFAKKRAHALGYSNASSIIELVEKSDLIVVAVPISRTREQIRKVQEAFKKRAENRCKAIIEVSSIKTPVLSGLEKSIVPLISMHPLFGPSAHHYGKNTMAVIKLGHSQTDRFALNLVRQLFPQFEVLGMGAEAHDKQMAAMLSLPHSLVLAFGEVLARNRSFIGNKGIATASYNTMKEFTAKTLSENPEIYYEISSLNEFTPKVLQELEVSISKLSKALEHGDSKAYLSIWEKQRRSL
jgi:chorismate mutase